MNIIDNMIGAFSPQSALKREIARQKLDMLRTITNSGYDEGGASHRKNSMKGWNANSLSPQKDIDLNIATLRKRSRNLFMTAPLATSAIKTTRTNVVGGGLILKPVIDYEYLGMSRESADKLKSQIQREWKLWAESKYCDNMMLNNFYELQQIAMVSWLMNGDSLGLIRYNSEELSYMPYQLRIKLIESDRLCTPKSYGESIDLHEKNPDTGNRIINGIEIDDHGTVVAYHICSSYPSEYDTVSSEWTRVEAIGKKTGNPNIIHVMEAERCEQYRGVPFLSPVIESLKQLTRYQEAEIMAAVINGMFAVFIKTESGNDDVDFDGVDEGENRVDEENESSYELGNGIINVLKEGESIEIADAKRPNSNFDGFMTAMTKYIGAALEIPVELVTKSFTASYSASRAALLEAWKMFRMRRTWFANDFCKPIYEIWFAEAVAKGRINAPGFFNDPLVRKAYCGSEWVGPAPGQLDPVKEATGAKLRIENGFSTHETEAAEINGSSFDSNIEQLRVENKKLQEVNKEE